MPLRCGSAVLGHVRITSNAGSRVSGEFTPGPDFSPYRAIFERAVEAFRRVDASSDAGYQAKWQGWSDALRAINGLGLTFGEAAVPVEDFEIDGSWQVEFEPALWWQVE